MKKKVIGIRFFRRQNEAARPEEQLDDFEFFFSFVRKVQRYIHLRFVAFSEGALKLLIFIFNYQRWPMDAPDFLTMFGEGEIVELVSGNASRPMLTNYFSENKRQAKAKLKHLLGTEKHMDLSDQSLCHKW